MKRSVLIILLTGFLSQSVVAEVVKQELAARYAANLMGVSSLPVSDGNTRRTTSSDGVTADPEYYVFNNPSGGWVIISAEDRVTPVIGYSDKGSFDVSDLPSNIKWWMDGVAESIDKVRDLNLEAPVSVRNAWRALSAGNRAPSSDSKVLETALWNQGDPYNLYCPYVNGENLRPMTGCVATAISIIMRYHQWPERGHGQIGGYTTEQYPTYITAYSLDNHVYDWANMPLTDAGSKNASWTDEQKRQVAQLMHDNGVMIEMDYSYEGSGAASMLVAAAIKKHMSYAESAIYLNRSLYNLDEWFSLIKKEIDSDRPVLYSGHGEESGGHAFVCDGYDPAGSMLHINWGWGGSGNGFFAMDMAVSKDMEFPLRQAAVVGIVPDTATAVSREIEPFLLEAANGLYGLMPYEWVDMKKGSEPRFLLAWLMGNGTYEGEAEFKVCLMDKDGIVKQEGWALKKTFSKDDSNGYYYLTDKTALETTPELTDYFQVFAKTEGGIWKPLKGNRDVQPDAEGVYCGITPDPIIIIPDNCTAGQKIKPLLTKCFQAVTKVSWSLNGKPVEGSEMTLKSGTNVIRADLEYYDGTETTIIRSVTTE